MGKIKKPLKNVYVFCFILVFLFSGIYIYVLDKRAMPSLINYTSVQTKRLGMEVLKEAGTLEVNKLIKDKELFKIKENNSGEIQSIDFNTVLVNEAMVVAAKNVRARLKEVEQGIKLPEEMYFEASDKKLKNGIIYMVPVGVILKNSFFADIGPRVPIKIKYSGNVGLDIKSRVKQYGINSALIEIYIKIEVTQRTILPFQSKDTKLISEIPIIMKVVKGDIPNYFYDTNKSYNLPME